MAKATLTIIVDLNEPLTSEIDESHLVDDIVSALQSVDIIRSVRSVDIV